MLQTYNKQAKKALHFIANPRHRNTSLARKKLDY